MSTGYLVGSTSNRGLWLLLIFMGLQIALGLRSMTHAVSRGATSCLHRPRIISLFSPSPSLMALFSVQKKTSRPEEWKLRKVSFKWRENV